MKIKLYLLWVVFAIFTFLISEACQSKKEPTKIEDPIVIAESEQEAPLEQLKSPINAIALNGIKRNTHDILFQPFLGREVSKKLFASEATTMTLDSIPESGSFRIGKEVWILNLGRKVMYDKVPIIQVPAGIKNRIAKINLIKGHYRFNGGDIALEITLENPLPDGLGWYIMTDEKLAPEIWNTKKEIDKLSEHCAAKVESLDFTRARPITDLNRDGFPEFYFPFSDSNEGTLMSICNDSPAVNVYFFSGL